MPLPPTAPALPGLFLFHAPLLASPTCPGTVLFSLRLSRPGTGLPAPRIAVARPANAIRHHLPSSSHQAPGGISPGAFSSSRTFRHHPRLPSRDVLLPGQPSFLRSRPAPPTPSTLPGIHALRPSTSRISLPRPSLLASATNPQAQPSVITYQSSKFLPLSRTYHFAPKCYVRHPGHGLSAHPREDFREKWGGGHPARAGMRFRA